MSAEPQERTWQPGTDREQERLEALHRYHVLDTAPDPVFDDLAALAAEITGSPTALISFVDADRQWFKAAVSFPFKESPRSISFCAHTIRQSDVAVVEDATADPRFAHNPLVTGDPGIRFYAGAPLVTPDGYALGTVCGIGYEPRTLGPSQREALRRLAGQVVRELELRRQAAELTATVTGHRRPDPPEMLQDVLDGSPALVSVKDTAGRYLLVNRALQQRLGLPRERILRSTDEDLFGGWAAAVRRREDLLTLSGPDARESVEQVPPGTEDRLWSTSRFLLRDWRGESYAVCSISSDVTDRVRAEEAARRSGARADKVMAESLDGVVTFSADGTVVQLNPAAERMFGVRAGEVVGRDVTAELVAPLFREDVRRALDAYADGDARELVGRRLEILGRRRDGELFPAEMAVGDAGEDPGRFIAFVRDVSDRHHAEQQLRHLAERDPLTGLANRATFFRSLSALSGDGVPGGELGSLMLVDLDAFKHINDTFGHRAGDDCLRHVAAVLHERVRERDVLARLGGDEFAVLLPAVPPSSARQVAASLLGLLRERPLVVDGRPVRLTASIGVAPVVAGSPPEDLLQAADAAMYEAKQEGRDRVAVYGDVALAARSSALRSSSTQHLRDALAEERFTLHAQPIVDLRSGAVASFELLVRMLGEHGELVPPGAFLPAAERFDLVQRIDCWVVEQAVGLLAGLGGLDGGAPPTLHVNLSGRSLSDPSVLACIERHLSGADASRLVFEVTETAAVTHLDTAISFTRRLAELGCGLSLDDFGAGYASFYYLKHLPVQSVKIDGDFVRGILTDNLDRAVVRATVTLAEDMGYRTIAEYVETPEHLEELRGYGIDLVQGFHTGAPVAAGVALAAHRAA
ncbi:hypothetical protein NUM3379_27560 [Kineococcus sp. NUM-3379]